ASRGLGAAVAAAYCRAGASLVLVARDGDALWRSTADLNPGPGQVIVPVIGDVAQPETIASAVQAALGKGGGLHVLVNNAAIQGPIGPCTENDWAGWRQALEVDLLAPVALCRAAVPIMLQSGRGSIINVSGGGATGPRPNFSAYATAKAGLVRFSETLAEELKQHGIRVNCVAPGAMNTAMLQQIVEQGEAHSGAREHSLARKILAEGSPALEQAAALCVFLASDAAAGITGKLISAVWDPWSSLGQHREELESTDIYTLRRIVPKDRGREWGGP
ncbi:MAG TPA: SDR family oxidoreductase, partial [bacterium]|nr:SDR family oxidoreductase [bacterium]